MDLIIRGLRIPVEKDGIRAYLKAASEKIKADEKDIKFVRILGKSLDGRNKKQFYYEISIVVNISDSFNNKDGLPVFAEDAEFVAKVKGITERPIIIGFGPAGMFAALELVNRGIRPLIFERGRKIEERSTDIERLVKERELNPESNVQFGEGGAGLYSDGKLLSRIKGSGYVKRVLDTFIRFGAPGEIGYVNRPHLGTDVLHSIVKKIRSHIIERGGEILYSSKMTDMIISEGQARGIIINGEKEYRSSLIYLAPGNAARDTFEMMHKKGICIEQKPIAVGVRTEHPAEMINLMRYGKKYKDFKSLGAADYSFTFKDKKTGRGVYTFCMCPGGEVINASSEKGMLVVNGMSYSKRSSPFSNSAVVVTCCTDDYDSSHPLAGIEFQRTIEKKAFKAGGGNWRVPAQNMTDFLSGRISGCLNTHSYKMGAESVNMIDIFPEFVGNALISAFNGWKEIHPLFVSDSATLLGTETRTSSPVRIKRNEDYESVNVKNLYPIGEGSGYAGGITSSAVDAIKAVERSLSYQQDKNWTGK